MKSINKFLFIIASLSFVFLFESKANSKSDKWISEKINLSADNWCPYNCKPDSKNPGLMIEVARKAFGTENVNYTILPWKRAIQEARDLKIDGIVGSAQSDAPDFMLSKPLGKSVNCFYARKNDPWVYKDHQSIKGKKLGYVAGYSYPDFVVAHINDKENGMDIEISGDGVIVNLLKMVAANRIDIVTDDESVLNYILSENPDLTKELKMAGCTSDPGDLTDIGISFPPKSQAKSLKLVNRLNATIEEMIQNGEMIKLVEKYKMKPWW